MMIVTCMPRIIFPSAWNSLIPPIPQSSAGMPMQAENQVNEVVQSSELLRWKSLPLAGLSPPSVAIGIKACPTHCTCSQVHYKRQNTSAHTESHSPVVQQSRTHKHKFRWGARKHMLRVRQWVGQNIEMEKQLLHPAGFSDCQWTNGFLVILFKLLLRWVVSPFLCATKSL